MRKKLSFAAAYDKKRGLENVDPLSPHMSPATRRKLANAVKVSMCPECGKGFVQRA
jgi:hypothetical protein